MFHLKITLHEKQRWIRKCSFGYTKNGSWSEIRNSWSYSPIQQKSGGSQHRNAARHISLVTSTSSLEGTNPIAVSFERQHKNSYKVKPTRVDLTQISIETTLRHTITSALAMLNCAHICARLLRVSVSHFPQRLFAKFQQPTRIVVAQLTLKWR